MKTSSEDQEAPRTLCRVCALGSPRSRALGLKTYPLRQDEQLHGFDIEPYDDLQIGQRDATALAHVLAPHLGTAACIHGRRLSIRGRANKLRRIGRAFKVAAKEIGSRRLRVYAHLLLETGPFHRSRTHDITKELL